MTRSRALPTSSYHDPTERALPGRRHWQGNTVAPGLAVGKNSWQKKQNAQQRAKNLLNAPMVLRCCGCGKQRKRTKPFANGEEVKTWRKTRWCVKCEKDPNRGKSHKYCQRDDCGDQFFPDKSKTNWTKAWASARLCPKHAG